MTKEPKELCNGFLFLRTGDKVDSPLVAYTLNLESVNIDCLEEEFEEKIEALKNGKDVTIKLVCNKAEVVSPERIIEYACGKQKQPEIVTCEDAISRQQMLEKIRTMQTYKLAFGDDMILIDKAQVQTELMMLPSAQPEPCEDAVSKEAVLSMIDTYMNKSVELHYLPTSDGIKKLISILPSIQPDIIRCKDCAYCDSDVVDAPYGMTKKIFWCDRLYAGANENLIVEPDDFCSWAEKRAVTE